MSLINQMLRDLEQRQQTITDTPQLVVKMPTTGAASKQQRWLLPAVALLAAVIGFIYARKQTIPAIPDTTETARVAQPQPANNPIPGPLPDNQPESVTTASAVVATNDTSAAPLEPPPTALQTSSTKPTPVKAPVTMPERGKDKSVIDSSQPSKLSDTQQAERLFRQAQQNNQDLDKLRQALTLNPRHLPARQLMLQRLSNSGDNSQLRVFLDDSLERFPNNLSFIKARAHLYLQHKDPAAALQILQRSDGGNDSGYWALLAATQQASQNYRQSADSYQRLLQLQDDKAEHWLGLAIAQDHLNQPEAAAAAYRRALDKNTLKPEVIDYIYQRLNVLAR